MKTVFTAREVPHVWAQQSIPHGRGSNVFFDGDTIYSYGRHFPMARIVTVKGQRVALVTTRRYSNTTARHLSSVRYAVSHLPVFHVHDVRGAESANVRAYDARVDARFMQFANARSALTKEWRHSEALELLRERNEYARLFTRHRPREEPTDVAKLVSELKALAAAERKRETAREARAAAERAKRQAEREREAEAARVEWVAGRSDYVPNWVAVALRVRGETVETSKGATFPVDHARRAWPLIKRARDAGGWQSNGHKIHLGHYLLDRIDAEGTITAGCHVVPFDEARRIAIEIGAETV